jgi:glycosyltransferase involved in cell wall biosynthesis
MNTNKYCLVIPHFNHVANLAAFLPQILSADLPCLIVDDGSTENAKQALRLLLSDIDQCQLTEHQENLGKGAAMMTGAKFARNLGYTHILQIDADGQHDVSDIPAFIEYSKTFPEQIISGAP